MNRTFTAKQPLLAAAVASLFVTQPAMAQTSPQETASVVVTGTRVSNRSVLDTTAPVDVITRESLEEIGVTEVNEALSAVLPSVNFPRPSLTDGTDSVRPATLRGLSPDQTLVLVNSKRRHSSALINVNGSIGRGASAADLNTIPSAIVRTIEVLRDGASAQYGSDAIAGVVNVRLRTDRKGGAITAQYGARHTQFDFHTANPPAGATWAPQNSRKLTDGQVATVNAWKGFALGETGYLTVAAELKDQHRTTRGGYDMRQQYPKVGGSFDPREQTINRFNAWSGEPELKQATLFANAGNTLANGMKVYGWASYQKRDTHSGGFFRRPLQDENVMEIYPDGYLPLLSPNIDDFSAAGGLAWDLGEWEMDASASYGRNKFMMGVENSLNRSLGTASKTSFDSGGLVYDQLTLNLSGVRKFNVAGLASPLNLALGTEARREEYEIIAGEPDSYRYGGVLLNGRPTPPGAQVYPGFQPSNAGSHFRTAVGVFADIEAQLSAKLLASAALRGEHYSDFGNNLSGKLAARYDFTPNFGLRSSLQNGFRAPSPQQQFFTSTSTNFIGGVPFDIMTLTPSDPVAVALGAKPLNPEKSKNLSAGAVLRFDNGISVTVDAYRIDIKDRIVLSENLTATNVRAYLASQGFPNAGGGRFFLNGVDTITKGLDVVLNMPLRTAASGRFDVTLAGNVNKNEVTRVPETQIVGISPAPVLFNRNNISAFEDGQPKNKVSATVRWKLNQWGATLRARRYGEVMNAGNTAASDFVIEPRTLVDVEARYQLNKKLQLALGADNLFDMYSNPVRASLNSTGAVPFSAYTPFGRSGRFIYARLKYSLE